MNPNLINEVEDEKYDGNKMRNKIIIMIMNMKMMKMKKIMSMMNNIKIEYKNKIYFCLDN